MVGGMTVGLIVSEPDEARIDVAAVPRRRVEPGVQYTVAF
jgi:hypothetical protein